MEECVILSKWSLNIKLGTCSASNLKKRQTRNFGIIYWIQYMQNIAWNILIKRYLQFSFRHVTISWHHICTFSEEPMLISAFPIFPIFSLNGTRRLQTLQSLIYIKSYFIQHSHLQILYWHDENPNAPKMMLI